MYEKKSETMLRVWLWKYDLGQVDLVSNLYKVDGRKNSSKNSFILFSKVFDLRYLISFEKLV